ncbi:hypothetical protein Tco_1008475 [Tanacetum coccineum]
MLNVGPTTGSLDQQALETEVTQLKDALTSLRIQNDGYKIENANVNQLVKPNTCFNDCTPRSSRTLFHQKEPIWVQPTPMPTKKQMTFQDPHRSSPRPAQKPQVQQHKKPTVPVNVSQKPKPATVARKPNPKNNFRNHSRLPTKSVKARRAADYYRNLYVDIGQFVVHSTKSVHVKTPRLNALWNTSKNGLKDYKEDGARIVPSRSPRVTFQFITSMVQECPTEPLS